MWWNSRKPSESLGSLLLDPSVFIAPHSFTLPQGISTFMQVHETGIPLSNYVKIGRRKKNLVICVSTEVILSYMESYIVGFSNRVWTSEVKSFCFQGDWLMGQAFRRCSQRDAPTQTLSSWLLWQCTQKTQGKGEWYMLKAGRKR